jgi:hypothetical protein
MSAMMYVSNSRSQIVWKLQLKNLPNIVTWETDFLQNPLAARDINAQRSALSAHDLKTLPRILL